MSNGPLDERPDVYDACLHSAHLYTAGFNPNIEYLPFVDRFELHLQNWERKYDQKEPVRGHGKE